VGYLYVLGRGIMYQDSTLLNHINSESVVKSQALVIAEWNLNYADNIKKIGNYRYRPTSTSYSTLQPVFDENDAAGAYKNGTYSDIVVDAGIKDDNTPITFKSNKEKQNLLFSLEDCFGKFRPRSGINKFVYFNSKTKIPNFDKDMALRPRYYFANKDDKFKYWTSFRTESGDDYGIAKSNNSIEDVAPFIVYKNKVSANKIVIKMQTHIGTVDKSVGTYSDPFYGAENAAIPTEWKIEKLDANNNWRTLIDYGSMPTDIAADGYLELSYGLIVPNAYKESFIHAGEFSSTSSLPTVSNDGYAYLVKTSNTDIGTYYIWQDILNRYDYFSPSYGWERGQETPSPTSNFVTKLSNLDKFVNPQNQEEFLYREIEELYGLRIVVREMNKVGSTFDLIELSPRLTVNLSDFTESYSLTKPASDIGNTGLPVGQLLAGTGSVTIFDSEQAFSDNNAASIIQNLPSKNVQFKFYEVVSDVADTQGVLYTYYIPLKTMYAEEFPDISLEDRKVTFKLRDMYLYFEAITAPELLIVNRTLSYILSIIFDSIGFSNYKFYRVANEKEKPIPYFFVGPDKTVAQVLNDLAVATQTAMFFDEANNFIFMSKEYMLPLATERSTDLELTADNNIISANSVQNQIFNSGKIVYTTKYIQKSYGTLRQASLLDSEKTWIYKPVLLWEVSPSDSTKPINEEESKGSGYTLSAMPLSANLPAEPPTVVNGVVKNNILDFGEGIYWISRYAGYFYANGEVIKYDAVEFEVSGYGQVWISSVEEYRNYFSKLRFNGKIFPTGRVRIYSEPFVDSQGAIVDGSVAKHGRSQFGTTMVSHKAGIDSGWTDGSNLGGCYMNSEVLFAGNTTYGNENGVQGIAGKNQDKTRQQQTTANGIIKNFFSSNPLPESTVNTLKTTSGTTGILQASALVLNGPSFDTSETATDSLSYVHKKLDNRFVHFGTRMRIVGKMANISDSTQYGVGNSPFYNLKEETYDKVVTQPDGTSYVQKVSTPDTIVSGSSGGIAVLLNPNTNNGYYFEIAALTTNELSNYSDATSIYNTFFYKISRNKDATQDSEKAVPTVLWAGLGPILVDDGKFTGQGRMAGEQNPTVYDLAVEYEDKANSRIFYLYINNKMIASVEDTKPLEHVNDNNVALFIRGSSRVMYENIYAMSSNYSQNTSSLVKAPVINKAFYNQDSISVTDSFRKYALSGMISSTYLSTIGASQPPDYNIYFEEFGTIMRECAYFNIRYDKAYPALHAKMSPTFTNVKGYTVSNFIAGAYGAEFMIFNNTDSILNLDETTGNYLRIQGITFTQQSQNELTVDEYFSRSSDLSLYNFDTKIVSQAKRDFNDIKNSRITYGKKEFSLDSQYIQSQDEANSLMGWMIKKIMHPRKSVGLEIVNNPMIQLGDIVTIDYTINGVDELSSSRFVVYSIEQSRGLDGPSMTIYLSEVV
jgi:hypothetical protein